MKQPERPRVIRVTPRTALWTLLALGSLGLGVQAAQAEFLDPNAEVIELPPAPKDTPKAEPESEPAPKSEPPAAVSTPVPAPKVDSTEFAPPPKYAEAPGSPPDREDSAAEVVILPPADSVPAAKPLKIPPHAAKPEPAVAAEKPAAPRAAKVSEKKPEPKPEARPAAEGEMAEIVTLPPVEKPAAAKPTAKATPPAPAATVSGSNKKATTPPAVAEKAEKTEKAGKVSATESKPAAKTPSRETKPERPAAASSTRPAPNSTKETPKPESAPVAREEKPVPSAPKSGSTAATTARTPGATVAKSDTHKAEPAKTEVAKSESTRPTPAKSEPIKSDVAKAEKSGGEAPLRRENNTALTSATGETPRGPIVRETPEGKVTVLTGTLETSIELGPAQSPVVIEGNFVIPAGAALRLKAGTVVQLKADPDGLASAGAPDPAKSAVVWVMGSLVIEGVTGNPVEILNKETEDASILFYGTESSRLEGARVKNTAIAQSGGISQWTNCEFVSVKHYALAGGVGTFTQCTFRQCGGIFATYPGSPWALFVRRSHFDGCREGIVLGSNPGEASLVVERNHFIHTRGAHIRAMPLPGTTGRKPGARRDGNGELEVLIGENWYGTSIPEEVDMRIVDKRIDPTLKARVNIRPPAEQPYTNIGAGVAPAVLATTVREQQNQLARLLQAYESRQPKKPETAAVSNRDARKTN